MVAILLKEVFMQVCTKILSQMTIKDEEKKKYVSENTKKQSNLLWSEFLNHKELLLCGSYLGLHL